MTRCTSKASLAGALLLLAGAALAQGEAGSKQQDTESRLVQVPVLARVIMQIKDHYVDPARIQPRKMVVAALDEVAREVDDLTIDGTADGDTLRLRMGAETHTIDLNAVRSIWEIRNVMKVALPFVGARTSADPAAIERAAANGMLSTLDRGNLLLGPEAVRETKPQSTSDGPPAGIVRQIVRDLRLTGDPG